MASGASGRSVGDLDKVGFDFDGGGDEAGEFDDEAAFAHPSDRQQASVVAVEHAADDALTAKMKRSISLSRTVMGWSAARPLT